VEKTQVVSDIHRLLESLEELAEPVAMPFLVVVSGLPGAGKSYFSKRLAEKVPFLVLESDALRKILFPTPSYSSQESSQLFRVIHLLLSELLKKGIPIILDATNLSERFREQLYGIVDRLDVKLVLVLVEAPPDVVYQRLESRITDSKNKSDADWSVYRRMLSSVDEIQRNHYVVDTSRDINPVIERIVREIRRG
jgi:predicted kinase